MGQARAPAAVKRVKHGKGNINRSEQANAGERREKKVARLAEAHRQAHQEVAQLKPVVRPGKQENRNDGKL